MWLVALQNEGNSSQLYISIYFPECLVFSFGGSEFTFFSTFVLHMQAKYLISIKTQHQFSSRTHNLHIHLSPFESLKLKLRVEYLLRVKSKQLFSAPPVHSPVFKAELLAVP